MPRFEIRESRRQLTSYAGLSLIGQCIEVSRAAPWLDEQMPVSAGMKTSDIVKSMVGLLSLGKNDFDAIEPFRRDRFFRDRQGPCTIVFSIPPGARYLMGGDSPLPSFLSPLLHFLYPLLNRVLI